MFFPLEKHASNYAESLILTFLGVITLLTREQGQNGNTNEPSAVNMWYSLSGYMYRYPDK